MIIKNLNLAGRTLIVSEDTHPAKVITLDAEGRIELPDEQGKELLSVPGFTEHKEEPSGSRLPGLEVAEITAEDDKPQNKGKGKGK